MANHARERFPRQTTRLIKATSDRVMCHVHTSRELAELFESRRGLRQGDGLSCSLFNIGLEGVVRKAGIDTSGSVFNEAVQLLACADDIDLIARNPKTVKDICTRLKAEARRIGLAMNTKKTKYMKGRSSKNDDLYYLKD